VSDRLLNLPALRTLPGAFSAWQGASWPSLRGWCLLSSWPRCSW
jgi:hypothetical protein